MLATMKTTLLILLFAAPLFAQETSPSKRFHEAYVLEVIEGKPAGRTATPLPGAQAPSRAALAIRSHSSGKEIPTDAAAFGRRLVEVIPGRLFVSRQ